jgi:REP element-mobilizing transposase RayT
MSQPREIVPGATYLVTRRTLRRHFLFRPDAAITQLLVYALAVSTRRFGLQVHAFCAMSTHLHLVVTDVQGVLPRFLQFFHRIVALGTKVLRKWEGPVWAHEATSVVRLLTHAAVVEKIAYVLANPVAAGLVRRAHEWPGAKVNVGEIGRGELRANRPSAYLDPSNQQWPEEATLPIALPPSVDAGSAARFLEDVGAELERQEAEAQAELQRRGHRFLGAARARDVSPYHRATSFEAQRNRNPTFSVGRGQGGAWQTAAAAVRAFRASYRAALARWRAGIRDAVFPVGTWWMKAFHRACVGDAMLVAREST